MCGIAGMVGLGRADLRVVRRMTALLAHRGPDDEGFMAWREGDAVPLSGPDTAADARTGRLPYLPSGTTGEPELADVVLGNRRLAIVDLSVAGHQPLCTPDRSVWVTHNGEIYNHVELRRELEVRGHSFAGHSDTEVIAAAYAEWGTQCFERFNGMWATAVWDGRLRVLVLSRDRFGVKPLYIARLDSGAVSFASEIKPLLAAGARARANEAAVQAFTASGRVDVSGAKTCFTDIDQVEPGTYVVCDVNGAVNASRFYTPMPSEDADPSLLLALLEDAVRLRLRSDVPVGSCLSGGLDSSSIVALAQAHLREVGARMRTFTFGAGAEGLDETPFANAVADAVGAEALLVGAPDDLVRALEKVVWEQEEPVGSGSVVAQRQVMACAHEHGAKVLLDGQGGDEVFAGYAYYQAARLADLAASLRGSRLLREFRGALAIGPADVRWLARGTVGQLRRRRARPRLVDLQLEDLRFHLPALLHYEDRNSMAFSIETRLPFLDYRIVEFGLGLNGADKVDRGWTKAALRRAVESRLPTEVVWRKEKVQFAVPQQRWLHGPLRELAGDVLAAEPDARELLARVDTLDAGSADRLWRLLALELWSRTFLGGSGSSRLAPAA